MLPAPFAGEISGVVFILFAWGLVCRSLLVNCCILEAKMRGVEKSISFWLPYCCSPSKQSSRISGAGRSVATSNAVLLLLRLSLHPASMRQHTHTYIHILICHSRNDDVKSSHPLQCEVSWLISEQLSISTEISRTRFTWSGHHSHEPFSVGCGRAADRWWFLSTA